MGYIPDVLHVVVCPNLRSGNCCYLDDTKVSFRLRRAPSSYVGIVSGDDQHVVGNSNNRSLLF